MPKSLLKYFPSFIILIPLGEIISKTLPGKLPQAYNYIVYIMFGITCLLYYCNNFKRIHKDNKFLSWIYIYIIAYIIVGFIKQYFVPSGLFPFFRLSISMALLSLGSIFIFRYENYLIKRTFHLWWKYIPIIFILTFWKLEASQYIRLLSFSLFFLMLFPLLKTKYKIIIIIMIAFIMIGGMEQRIDYINITISFLLLIIIKYAKRFSQPFFTILFRGLMLIPLFFVTLFWVKGFNILQLNQFIDDETQLAGQLNDDTRSFLYEEAWDSGINNKNLIHGRTPFYGYDSNFAENREGDAFLRKGQKAQRVSEVFIVNTLAWFGIIGIIIFFLFYYKIGMKTLSRTQNPYLSVFTIYIGFFWFESWIGNLLFVPNTSYILLYMIISMCHNPRLNKMETNEMKLYLANLSNS